MKLRSWHWAFSLFLGALGACNTIPRAVVVEHHGLQLQLPERYLHWQQSFTSEWQSLLSAQQPWLSSWQSSVSGPYQLVLLESPQAAIKYYNEHRLLGRADTPRTFIDKRLAILVLPADDRLLAELPSPPQTILHDFRHEASHLLSCDVKQLLDAPMWFQEGWAEYWSPLSENDRNSWPHAHDIYRWFPSLNWSNLESAPAEVRYSFLSRAAELVLEHGDFPDLDDSRPEVIVEGPRPFRGLRGRHAYWDVDNSNYLIAARQNSQVDLDLPFTWDGGDDLVLSMRVGATSSPASGIALYPSSLDAAEAPLLRIPIDVNGGINAFVDRANAPKIRPLISPTSDIDFGGWRTVVVRVEGDLVFIQSEDFEKSIKMGLEGLQLPFAIRMYSRNGILEIKHEKIH